MMRESRVKGVFEDENGSLYTRNLVPGRKVYGEPLVADNGIEYRSWNPTRSKLSAAVKCGLEEFAFGPKSRCLYLGAASGTTVSHVSDLCHEGTVFAVEISARCARDLVELAKWRRNIVPVLGDANNPENYIASVDVGVEILYQDVAQRNQAEIFVKNAGLFLKSGGIGYLMLKTRSVDVTASPEAVLASTTAELKVGGFKILETIDLGRYEKDHYAIVARLR